MSNIPPKDFIKDLSVSDNFKKNFSLFSPVKFGYNFLVFNTRNPILSDKSVRQALSHLVDGEKMIETVYYGFAERVNSPVHPSNKEYNDSIKPLEYNPEKAKTILSESGWKDSNGNGIPDKSVNGKRMELEITLIYNNGSSQRESIALIFQEEARKAGIKINLKVQELSVISEKLKKHDFDIFCGGMSNNHLPVDYKQQWHTESINGGFNFSYFGNAQTDAMIDSMRNEMNEEKRIAMSKKLQEIIHEEVPMIFLFAEKDRIVINKKFSNADAYSLRPGYWEGGLQNTTKK